MAGEVWISVTTSEWEEVEYAIGSHTSPAMHTLVTAMKEQFTNGGCLLTQFDAKDAAQFDAALAGDRQGHGRLLAAFLNRPEVRGGLAVLQIAAAANIPPAFRSMGTFELEGALVEILQGGGAYTRGIGSESRARALAKQFVDSLVGENRRHCTVFVIEEAWTPWFFDVAWDYSYLVFDPVARRWWTLFMTDTD